MTIDKQEIKALALACDPAKCADEAEESRRLAEFYSELTPELILALLAEIEGLTAQHGRDSAELRRLCSARDEARRERDQLKAENEQLRGAMHRVMEQVDGNIRETVRDCVNGRDDVQDIYGYCDAIELIISAAMAKEAGQ